MNITNEEAERFLNQMIIEFGTRLPNPVHHPMLFNHYVKMFYYLTQQKNKNP